MAQTWVSALEYLGTRVQWEALSAIGTVLAVFWAISLANRQAADTRRREAALLKACLVPTSAVFEHLREVWEMFEEVEDDIEGPSQIDLLRAKHRMEQAWASSERTLHFLEDLDLMRLPTTGAIVVLLQMRTEMKEAVNQMDALVSRGAVVHSNDYPPSVERFEQLIYKLGDEAVALGARATANDPLIFHMALKPAIEPRDYVLWAGHRVRQWRRKVFGLTKAERALDDEIPF